MKRITPKIFIFISLVMLSTTASYALDDGWYHAIEVKPPCGMLSQSVIFVEGDKPISGSIGSASYQVENPKKITAGKTKMKFVGGGISGEVDFTKTKNNLIISKITSGDCTGSQITLSK